MPQSCFGLKESFVGYKSSHQFEFKLHRLGYSWEQSSDISFVTIEADSSPINCREHWIHYKGQNQRIIYYSTSCQ